jgi:hypothetical protein
MTLADNTPRHRLFTKSRRDTKDFFVVLRAFAKKGMRGSNDERSNVEVRL